MNCFPGNLSHQSLSHSKARVTETSSFCKRLHRKSNRSPPQMQVSDFSILDSIRLWCSRTLQRLLKRCKSEMNVNRLTSRSAGQISIIRCNHQLLEKSRGAYDARHLNVLAPILRVIPEHNPLRSKRKGIRVIGASHQRGVFPFRNIGGFQRDQLQPREAGGPLPATCRV